MNEILERIVEVLDDAEGLCEHEFNEFKAVLQYVDNHKIVEKRDSVWKSKVAASLVVLSEEEMNNIIKNALQRLEKECKFGIPNKTGENNDWF